MNTAPEDDDGSAFLERLEKAKQEFCDAMDDDFNTPKAIAVLQDLTRDVNSLLNGETKVGLSVLNAINTAYSELGGTVLGLIPDKDITADGSAQREAGLIALLIDMRAKARAAKNYAEGDRIRDELAKLGVILEDRPDGTVWRVI
jgi:cysteinyl-tRNA synthetase